MLRHAVDIDSKYEYINLKIEIHFQTYTIVYIGKRLLYAREYITDKKKNIH